MANLHPCDQCNDPDSCFSCQHWQETHSNGDHFSSPAGKTINN
jgi:hypothetical protein